MKKLFLFLICFTCIFFFACNDGPTPPPGPGPEEPPIVDPEEKVKYSIEILNAERELYIGDSIELHAKVYPETSSQEVTWSVSNAIPWDYKTPASVEGNTITALNYGKVYVTASSNEITGLSSAIEIEIKHELLNEPVEPVFNVVGFYGEDASTMYNVHYMNKNKKAYVLLTTADDPSFSSATRYESVGYFYENLDETNETTWPARNVWDTRITNLTPNTSYIYKINNGDNTYTPVYHFTTGSSQNTSTSFIFMTDNHYSNSTNGTTASASVSEETVRKALEINSNISFILETGDRADCGGDRFIWEKIFKYSENSLTTLPYIDSTGNHELYFKGTGQRDSQFHTIHTAAPNNGSSDAPSSSYFVINDCLFICIDNAKHVTEYNQIKWAANVLETVAHKHSIIFFHTPVDYGSWLNMNYIKMFDKYAVDLVLSGHTHSHHFSASSYNGETSTDPNKGTTYLTGAFSGTKSTSNENAIHAANGYIIDIDTEGIHITRIHPDGVVEHEWDVPYKKGSAVEASPKGDLVDSIKLEYNEETFQANFTWSPKFYGNVKKITLSENSILNISDYEICPTPSYTGITLNGFEPGFKYTIHAHIDFNDNTSTDKDFELDLSPEFEIKVTEALEDFAIFESEYPGDDAYINIGEVRIILNGKKHSSLDNSSFKNEKNSFTLFELTENTEYKAVFEFYDFYGNLMFTKECSFKTL